MCILKSNCVDSMCRRCGSGVQNQSKRDVVRISCVRERDDCSESVCVRVGVQTEREKAKLRVRERKRERERERR